MKNLKMILMVAILAIALVFTACGKDTAKQEVKTETAEAKTEEKAETKTEATEEKKEEVEEKKVELSTAPFVETTKSAYSEEYTELEHGTEPEVGKAPVDFTVKTVDGSDTEVKLDQILASGELVHLNLFTTNCKYCIEEMPDLEELHKRDDVKVAIIGIGESPEALRNYMEKNNFDLPVFSDEVGEVALGYYVSGVPAHYYIKDGKIVGKMLGAWNSDVLNYIVDELNAGREMPDELKIQEVYLQSKK